MEISGGRISSWLESRGMSLAGIWKGRTSTDERICILILKEEGRGIGFPRQREDLEWVSGRGSAPAGLARPQAGQDVWLGLACQWCTGWPQERQWPCSALTPHSLPFCADSPVTHSLHTLVRAVAAVVISTIISL